MKRRIGKILKISTALVFIISVLSTTAFSNTSESELSAESSFPWAIFLPPLLTGKKLSESCLIGEWTRIFDWGCIGFPSTISDQINADHTWTASSGSYGTWSLTGRIFTYLYPNGTSYTGEVNSTCTAMSGTMLSVNGNTGCWTAAK